MFIPYSSKTPHQLPVLKRAVSEYRMIDFRRIKDPDYHVSCQNVQGNYHKNTIGIKYVRTIKSCIFPEYDAGEDYFTLSELYGIRNSSNIP
jgi:hypothetical protein